MSFWVEEWSEQVERTTHGSYTKVYSDELRYIIVVCMQYSTFCCCNCLDLKFEAMVVCCVVWCCWICFFAHQICVAMYCCSLRIVDMRRILFSVHRYVMQYKKLPFLKSGSTYIVYNLFREPADDAGVFRSLRDPDISSYFHQESTSGIASTIPRQQCERYVCREESGHLRRRMRTLCTQGNCSRYL